MKARSLFMAGRPAVAVCRSKSVGAIVGLSLGFLLGPGCLRAPAQTFSEVLVPSGADWRYLDDGSNPGNLWRALSFAAANWKTGPAQLGYGDGDEATLVDFGANPAQKHITTYFRHVLDVANPSRYADLTLALLCDDGAAVYLNNREIARINLPAGTINPQTPASTYVGGPAESAYQTRTITTEYLVSGSNVLAVEVHQASPSSSDLSFDLKLSAHRKPIPVFLTAPADGARQVSPNATLSFTLPEAGENPLTAIVLGRPSGPPPGPDFTLIALPDTQSYVSGFTNGQPATFQAQIDWIVANRQTRNIRFVTHLGDVVDHGDDPTNRIEWQRATNALYRLENPATTQLPYGIPYGVTVGNHDLTTNASGQVFTRFYNEYFGVNHFAAQDYYGGHWGTNNNNHYELFSASGLDFIIIHLEYSETPNPAVADWADVLLQTYANRRAILVSHYLLESGFQAAFSAQGQAVYEQLKHNPNLFLMLCGHVVPEEGQRTDTFNGQTIYTLMSNYQWRENGGNGWLRVLEFSPSNNVIRVQTYSPTLDRFETDADSEFTLAYDLRRGGAFAAVGWVTGINSPTNIALDWPGRAAGTSYDWKVIVSDGVRTTESPIQSFTTADNSGIAPPSMPSNLRILSAMPAANGHANPASVRSASE